MSREIVEKVERSVVFSLRSTRDTLSSSLSPSIVGRSPEYVVRRRIVYRINRDTSAFQPLVISLHFIRYPYSPSRALLYLSPRHFQFDVLNEPGGEGNNDCIASINWILLDSDSCQGTRNWISETLIRLACRSSGSEWNLEIAIREKVREMEREEKTSGSKRLSVPPPGLLPSLSRHVQNLQ